jgi:hypothetical protein
VTPRSSSAKRDSANKEQATPMPANVRIVEALFVLLVAVAAARRWGAGR